MTRVGSVLRNAPAGRKTLVFVSGGRCFTFAKGGWCTDDVSEAIIEVQEMFRTLQEANVTVYGRFRKVEVQVNRRDVEVRARSGYFAPKVEKSVRATSPLPSPVEVAIARGMPSGQIPLQATAASFALPGRREEKRPWLSV